MKKYETWFALESNCNEQKFWPRFRIDCAWFGWFSCYSCKKTYVHLQIYLHYIG